MASSHATTDVHQPAEVDARVFTAALLGISDEDLGGTLQGLWGGCQPAIGRSRVETVDCGQYLSTFSRAKVSYESEMEYVDEEEISFDQLSVLDIPLASWQGKMRMRSWTKGEPHEAFMDTADVLLDLEE